MSASAVRRIQSGMACAEQGEISRLSVITQGESPLRRRQLAVAQDVVEPQTSPELVADMDRTGFPMTLGRNPRRIDLDQRPAGPLRRSRQRGIFDAVVPVSLGAPGPHPTNDVGDLTVVRVKQIALADQCILDLARQLQPLLARPRAEIAKRADRVLPRPFRGPDRLHQEAVAARRSWWTSCPGRTASICGCTCATTHLESIFARRRPALRLTQAISKTCGDAHLPASQKSLRKNGSWARMAEGR